MSKKKDFIRKFICKNDLKKKIKVHLKISCLRIGRANYVLPKNSLKYY